MTNDPLSLELLQAIWETHGLGKIDTMSQPLQGNVNRCWIINDSHVIRFDVIDGKGISRYTGEKRAYELLKASDVPVPEVFVFDTSKSLASYDYLIMSKMAGTTISKSLSNLSPEAQAKLAYSAGQYLASIHSHSLESFGLLFEISAGINKPNWADFVRDFFEEYRQQSLALALLTEELSARLQALMEKMQPLFSRIRQGRFLHGDYHFSNLLQEDGQLSAVLDFEWALSGDTSWDFRFDDDLDLLASGSKAAFYAGYQSRRALPEQHWERLAFYRICLYLDFLATFAANDANEATTIRTALMKELVWLENQNTL